MPRLIKICQKFIEYSFYLLFFLVPLVMTPWNYELFEFNKMLTVYFFTIIIVSAWLIGMVLQKKIIFRRTFWDIPLLIFLASQFISFLLSIDKHTSLWGYYSRFNGGLISVMSYSLLYWAFVSNMDKIKTLNVIRYTLISAAIVSIYGIAEHFGIDAEAWVQDVKNRVFSTLGQPNWLAAWLVALILIPMAMILNHQASGTKLQTKTKHQAPNYKKFEHLNFKNWRFSGIWNLIIGYFLFFILFLCLLYTKSRSGILGFVVAFITFWGLFFLLNLLSKKQKQKKYNPYHLSYGLKNFLIITFLTLILVLLIPTPWQPKIKNFQLKNRQSDFNQQQQQPGVLISESSDIRKVVWKGALEIWKHHPFFGTGVETFAYSYYWYRPREHNDVSEWDFLYNKAHNEYLNYAATTGTFGLASYLLLIGSFVLWEIKNLKSQMSNVKNKSKISNLSKQNFSDLSCSFEFCVLRFAFLGGFISILVTNFFGFSVVAVNLLFFLLPAMSAILLPTTQDINKVSPSKVNRSSNLNIWQCLAVGGILIFNFYFLLFTLRYWYADKVFAFAEKLSKGNQTNQAFANLQKAVKIRPEPIYLDELGITAATLAVSAFKQEQATLSSQLVNLAIEKSNKALKISPYNLNFWKNRTRLFYTLSEIDGKYNQEALKTLLQASQIAPNDAKIAYNLAILYSKLGQEETAIKTLEKTIELKPNYDQARYTLGLFYEKNGEIEKAKNQYQYIIEKINPQHEQALEKLKNLK